MLRFSLLGFPIIVHWIFWLNTALMGGGFSADSPEELYDVLAWVVACFVSIVIHELGHAKAMHSTGDEQVYVVLHGFGGYAQGSRRLTRFEDIRVTAAGPGLQMLCGLAVGWAATLWRIPNAWLREVVDAFTVVSLFWALLNLVPVLPLDGGRICAAVIGSRRAALVISIITAVILAVSSFEGSSWMRLQNSILDLLDIHAHTRVGGGIFTLIFFGWMAVESFKQLKSGPHDPWRSE